MSKAQILPSTPNKLTPELEDRLVMLAEATPILEHIAAVAKVPYAVFRRWLKLGDEGDDRYASLAVRIHHARAAHHDRYMSQLLKVAETDDTRSYNAKVRAIEMLLKNQFPKTWGSEIYVKTMIEQKVDGFNLKALPRDVLLELQKAARVIKAANEGADEEEVQRLIGKLSLVRLKKEKAESGGPDDTTEE